LSAISRIVWPIFFTALSQKQTASDLEKGIACTRTPAYIIKQGQEIRQSQGVPIDEQLTVQSIIKDVNVAAFVSE